MSGRFLRWAPAVILGLGVLLNVGATHQRVLPLRMPLQKAVSPSLAGFAGTDVALPEAERKAAGVTDYLLRSYGGDSRSAFNVYVGYYASQMQGKTIHSPKNCLPGAGWEPLVSGTSTLQTAMGQVTVNRYLIQRQQEKALVLYWYQGRGRVASDEYRVKWDLLRDAALRHRSDEALVRIVVPITGSEEDAYRLARRVATQLVPELQRALPA